MKKILIVIAVIAILGTGGYLAFKYLKPGTKTQSNEPPKGTQLCDLEKQTCTSFEKTSGGGTLALTIIGKGKPVDGLEVDVGTTPGAPKYYMGLTDMGGNLIFDGIPAGSYSVYFNDNNFPKEFGKSPLVHVTISSGQNTKKTITLTSQ